MDRFLELATGFIHAYGLWGVFILATFEQFILPIPTEVFIAIGIAASLPFYPLMTAVAVAVLAGSSVGYFLGKKLGHPVFVRLFGLKRLEKTERLINKWGLWGVIGAGYIPLSFKLVSWSAGIFEFPFPKFILGVCLGRLPRFLIVGYLIHSASQRYL